MKEIGVIRRPYRTLSAPATDLTCQCHDERWKGYTVSEDVVRLLLEPWAVNAALSRRAGRKLDQREIDEKKHCIRDDGTIRWPEADK